MASLRTLRFRLAKKVSSISEGDADKPVLTVGGKQYSWRDLAYRTTAIPDERRKDARLRKIYRFGRFSRFSSKEAKKLLRAAEEAGLI